jgi:hypothetical protein
MLPNPFNPGVFHPDMSLFGRESQIQAVDQVVGQIENGYPIVPCVSSVLRGWVRRQS